MALFGALGVDVLLPGGDTKDKDYRASAESLKKNDGIDHLLWPFWSLEYLLSVLLPGGFPPLQNSVLESIAGFKADMLGMKTVKGGSSFDAPLPNGSFMRLPVMPLLSLSE